MKPRRKSTGLSSFSEGTVLKLIIALIPLFTIGTTAQGQVTQFIPNVPDENQPLASLRTNWCTPTAAVNITEYWDNIICNAGALGL